MGILNITPDSFSDGGELTDVATALQHAKEMVAAGADMLDVGGQSTRPGSDRLHAREEAARVLPVIRHAPRPPDRHSAFQCPVPVCLSAL